MSQVMGDLLPFVFLRALTILVGLAFAWMGYRLFLAGLNSPGGDLELEAGKGLRLKLMKVGPGIFFALFGAGIIIYQLTRVLQYSNVPAADAQPAPAAAEAQSTPEAPRGAGAPAETPVGVENTSPPEPGAPDAPQPAPSPGVTICDTCVVQPRPLPRGVRRRAGGITICDTCAQPAERQR